MVPVRWLTTPTRPEMLRPSSIEHGQALNDMAILSKALHRGASIFLSPKEKVFVGSMLDRFDRFGGRTFLSRKQAIWLSEIVARNGWMLSLVPANDNQLELLPKAN